MTLSHKTCLSVDSSRTNERRWIVAVAHVGTTASGSPRSAIPQCHGGVSVTSASAVDCGVVGDLHAVLPAAIEKVRERKG